MNFSDPLHMHPVDDVLEKALKNGVRFWSDNGQLRYKAPRGALTPEEIETLRSHRFRLLAFINAESAEQHVAPRTRSKQAPLAFSQLAHWHLYRLHTRKGIREVASATRVCGRLNLDVLRAAVTDMLRRHEALRTRIVISDRGPTQEVVDSVDCHVTVDDLTLLADGVRENEAIRRIQYFMLEPIDVSVDLLFGIRVVKIRDNEHVLVVAMEHMISDMASMNILLRDLFTAYMRRLKGQPISLPPVPVQFADYAAWQASTYQAWAETHGSFWTERSIESLRVRFPEDRSVPNNSGAGWQTVPFVIGYELKLDLQEWCRLRRTTLVMSVFTAYAALVLRWCNVLDAVIKFQTNGRDRPEVQNAVGYFSSILYFRIQAHEGDSFVDLLNRVTGEYCTAYEHADSSYMEAQYPIPEFARNTWFNWVPQGAGLDFTELNGSADTLKCVPLRFEHPMLTTLERDHEPTVILYDTEKECVGDLYFPRNRFSKQTMTRFTRNFLMFLRTMLSAPEKPVRNIMLLH